MVSQPFFPQRVAKCALLTIAWLSEKMTAVDGMGVQTRETWDDDFGRLVKADE